MEIKCTNRADSYAFTVTSLQSHARERKLDDTVIQKSKRSVSQVTTYPVMDNSDSESASLWPRTSISSVRSSAMPRFMSQTFRPQQTFRTPQRLSQMLKAQPMCQFLPAHLAFSIEKLLGELQTQETDLRFTRDTPTDRNQSRLAPAQTDVTVVEMSTGK